MEFLINYWYVVIGLLAIAGVGFVHMRKFYNLPNDEQLDKIREWLIYATLVAEQQLGGGTGQMKLRQVYDMFLVRFPQVAKIVSFAYFSTLVDDALVTVREMLNNNKDIKKIIEKEETK